MGDVLFGHTIRAGWHLSSFLLAVAGAIVLLLALEALGGKRRSRGPW
jgi:uncharacterized membrane protein YeaQ/YmgE (transglycosylase-associated protein family)